jgi:uncharacterized protein GlcG (DUF336 family)
MTLEDLTRVLLEAAETQTLTERLVSRCILLAYTMGIAVVDDAGAMQASTEPGGHPAPSGSATKCTDALAPEG